MSIVGFTIWSIGTAISGYKLLSLTSKLSDKYKPYAWLIFSTGLTVSTLLILFGGQAVGIDMGTYLMYKGNVLIG